MQKKGYLAIGALLLAVLFIAVAGCTAFEGGSSQSTSSRDMVVYTTSSGSAVKIAQSGSSSMYENSVAPVPTSAPYSSDSYTGTEQKIIRTGYVTLEVKNVSGSLDSLKALATAQGGYLSSSSMNKGSSDRMYGSVVLRVPAAQYDSTMTQLASLGTVISSQTSADDVTEEYVDLTAQKTALQNQLDQLNKIMAKATTVEDTLNVQTEIGKVQTDLDRINGRLKYLNNRVDLSTISVSLQEPEPIGSGVGHDFNAVINEAIGGFLGMIDALIIIFFALIPLIVIGGAAYLVYRWHKGRKGTSAEPGKTESAPEEKK